MTKSAFRFYCSGSEKCSDIRAQLENNALIEMLSCKKEKNRSNKNTQLWKNALITMLSRKYKKCTHATLRYAQDQPEHVI